jgi:ethanolamine utilization protein EutN
MLLVQIVGTVVSTHKDPKLKGLKLLIGKEIELNGKLTERYHVAVDTVGVGPGEVVVIVRGSSARMTETTDKKPVDTAIIAVVEEIEVDGKVIWKKT